MNRDPGPVYQTTTVIERTNYSSDHFLKEHGCHLQSQQEVIILKTDNIHKNIYKQIFK
ncbi:hypothetical protein HanXRQr2_Chr02g0055771 [Helianthus annuus]|uniref:Uncharacterized protein n=1 Tax=Helianthus annuus TaxID=4232 RepID=A0A9K3JMJ2_HELAN|nr:hypothetical protein HanXRQr2_Chr02g0055771 [Helianthus annuus]